MQIRAAFGAIVLALGLVGCGGGLDPELKSSDPRAEWDSLSEEGRRALCGQISPLPAGAPGKPGVIPRLCEERFGDEWLQGKMAPAEE